MADKTFDEMLRMARWALQKQAVADAAPLAGGMDPAAMAGGTMPPGGVKDPAAAGGAPVGSGLDPALDARLAAIEQQLSQLAAAGAGGQPKPENGGSGNNRMIENAFDEALRTAGWIVQKHAVVDAATLAGGAAGGMDPAAMAAAGGGGMDPAAMGMDPAAMGMAPAAMGGAPAGGGGDPAMDARLAAIEQQLSQLAAGGAAGGAAGAGGQLKPKIDINVEIMKLNKMMARVADALGVSIPAAEMVATPQDLTQMAAQSQGAPAAGGAAGGQASAIPPIDAMAAAAPAMAGGAAAGGGDSKSASLHNQGRPYSLADTADQLSGRAAALARIMSARK